VERSQPMNALSGFSLLIVDDHPLFRDGLVLALQQHAPDLQLVAVGTSNEAREQLARDPQRWDLVMLDYNLRDESGLLAALRLRQDFPGVAVGLMSGTDDPGLGERARAAGLVAFVPKSLEVGELLTIMEQLAQGGTWYPPALSRQRVLDLTSRQLEIVELASRGGEQQGNRTGTKYFAQHGEEPSVLDLRKTRCR
jgi:two-component system, NarL family, nitrate/nitrite response regulator NarL